MIRYLLALLTLTFAGSALAETKYLLVHENADLDGSGLANEKGMSVGQAGDTFTLSNSTSESCAKKDDGYGSDTNEVSGSAYYTGNNFSQFVLMFVHATNGKPIRIPDVLIQGDKPQNGKKFTALTRLDPRGAGYRKCLLEGNYYYKWSVSVD
jgi:hypothetical protein